MNSNPSSVIRLRHSERSEESIKTAKLHPFLLKICEICGTKKMTNKANFKIHKIAVSDLFAISSAWAWPTLRQKNKANQSQFIQGY